MKGLYHQRILLAMAWQTFANAVGNFTEELIFRLVLAFDVLVGRKPRKVERRWWNRAVETPVLVDVYDWTDERLISSVLVWPPLESSLDNTIHDYRQRIEVVTETIAKGAAEKAWSTYWEVDYGLVWSHTRQCWVDGDGHRYDGRRFGSAGLRRFGAGSRRRTHAA
jgi:hypothetical protein